MKNLLLVEDDPIIGNGLKLNLEIEGFEIKWAKSIAEATSTEKEKNFDLIILDLGLPDGNGIEFCRAIREKGSIVPVIILTAQADEDSVVEGFEAGANDYVKKPFSNRELHARIKSILKEPSYRDEQIRIGNLLMSVEHRRVTVDNEEVPLNRREFDLLHTLMSRPGVVVTRESIIERLQTADEIFDRTIDSHVSHLRAKLKKIEACTVRIKSEYGVGYRLVNVD